MSRFKVHESTGDRSAADRSRHKKKIEKAIKDGIYNIVSEESIIGQDGKKKIKIPVRGIKEYQFVYGDNGSGEGNPQVGSAKDVKKGQVIQKKQKGRKPGKGDKAGNEKGEEFYEIEMDIEEMSGYLFDDLNLPDLEKKKFKQMMADKTKRSGYRKQGINSRLSKKKTMLQRLKRKKAAIKNNTYDPSNEERFPFHQSDMRYKHIKTVQKESDAAVVFFVMDVSGSMSKSKKYIARSFFFLLYHFLRHKYNKVAIEFIAHTTEANVTDEDKFFNRGSSGGTYMSSGVEKVLEMCNETYHPNSWNIYTFHCSDGDNWSEDNSVYADAIKSLVKISQMYGLIEIGIKINNDISMYNFETVSSYVKHLTSKKFKIVQIASKTDIWQGFEKMFGGLK
jgi:sporulation protein YhbH